MGNNYNVKARESEARSVTNSADLTNSQHKGCHVIIDATSITDTPSVVPTIQGRDTVSGKYYTLLTGSAITGIGTTILKVYPGLIPAANLVANDILPSKFRILMTHADADSITYSVGVSLV
jgi:hypothetical protein